jgi:hypothetical protein
VQIEVKSSTEAGGRRAAEKFEGGERGKVRRGKAVDSLFLIKTPGFRGPLMQRGPPVRPPRCVF